MINFKEHYFTERRMKSDRNLMFHGTTNKFLKSILVNGLIYNPKEKVWKDDPDANFYNPSRISYGGTYFTNNLMTAISSGRNAVSKLGGTAPIIITALLQPRSALPDEDNFQGKVRSALTYALGDGGKYRGDHPPLAYDKYVQMLKGDDVDSMINHFITHLKNSSQEFWPEKHENVKELNDKLKTLFKNSLKRIISHSGNDLDSFERKRDLSVYFNDVYDNPEKYKQFLELPDIKEAETEYMKALDDVMNVLRRETLVKDEYNKTLRIKDNVGMSGRNRIVSIVEIENYMKKPTDEPYKLNLKYGTEEDANKFIQQFEERMSDKYMLQKD